MTPRKNKNLLTPAEEFNTEDWKKIREQVLEKIHERIQKEFKPEAKAEITPEMIERAVDEAVKGCTVMDIATAIEFSDTFCEKCGQCCRVSDPIKVNVEDMLDIATFLGISLDLVITNYTKQLQNGSLSLKTRPCVFIQGNQCTIYPARPRVCRTFPIRFKKRYATLTLYDYCSFTKNFMVEKAKALLIRYLVDKHRPELSQAMESHMKQLKEEMPKDYPSQLLYMQKCIKSLFNVKRHGGVDKRENFEKK